MAHYRAIEGVTSKSISIAVTRKKNKEPDSEIFETDNYEIRDELAFLWTTTESDEQLENRLVELTVDEAGER